MASQSVKLNSDPNLTPDPIRTHDRAPNPNQRTSQKNFKNFATSATGSPTSEVQRPCG